MRTRARHYADCLGRGGFLAVAALFLPRTWPTRLVFMAVILFSASFPVPKSFKIFTILPGAILLVGFFGFMFFGEELDLYGDEDDDIGTGLLVAACAALVGIIVLAFLVTNGQNFGSAHDGSARSKAWSGAAFWACTVLLLATLWLLIGVPHQARRIRLAPNGYAQRVLVRVITAAACILTAALLLLMHFDSGPLENLPAAPLATGIVFTVLLAAPFYRSLAQATWRRGFPGILSPKDLRPGWRKMAREVRIALDQAAKDEVESFNDKTQKEKPDQDDAAPRLEGSPRRRRASHFDGT
jgi:hypothetical protein